MRKSEQGVTMVELLITMAIVTVVLAGTYSPFLSSSKSLTRQNDLVEMQTDGRAAMDFMVRELRLAYGVDGVSTRSGCSSGGETSTTLNDTTQTWPVGANGFNTSYAVRITAGTGKGQARSISSNTSTQLTVASPWTTTPDSSSCYVIIQEPIISTTVTTNDTITFDRLVDSGYSSGGNTTTTLNDATISSGSTVTYTGKAWSTSSPFDNSYTVKIISGTGAGQARSISSNTSQQLTVSPAWAPTPDSSSCYVITRQTVFTRTSASDNSLRYAVGGGNKNQLANLITSHSFSSDPNNPDTIGIALTAQAANAIDPNTKQKRQYTLTETVLNRN